MGISGNSANDTVAKATTKKKDQIISIFLPPFAPFQLQTHGYCRTATAAPKNASLSSAETNRLVPTFANHSAATFVYP